MNLLFEDQSITVAIKPPELLSEQTPEKNGFADLLAARNPNSYVGVVHRLDRGVGGVMVYARTPQAAARLSAAIQARDVEKQYLAVVHGELPVREDTLRDLLFHDRTRNKTFVVARERHGVKEAVLDYRTLGVIDHGEHGRLSLLHIKLHTGRTHQIRVQFSSRRHPLLGDGKYGAHDRCGIALVSHSLRFPHPITGKVMEFSYTPIDEPWTFFS
ncbi:MAG: RluA family pseudouridine synthase [Ruminococcaceae bacterium]|nr:RluA family pseudouridine synthase [Oscillospiraceae bacterium]